MILIPVTEDVLVLRTDFSNDEKWERLCAEISTPDPEYGFQPYVVFLSDRQFEHLSAKEIVEALPADYEHPILFVVDGSTMESEESPVLCLDLHEKKGQEMRVLPRVMWAIENNLSISNDEFSSFLESADEDGVYREI
jgi:hypothetical protein